MCASSADLAISMMQQCKKQSKPEPNMFKILPIIPSSTSQKFYPLFLFYSYIITYYSHIILLH